MSQWRSDGRAPHSASIETHRETHGLGLHGRILRAPSDHLRQRSGPGDWEVQRRYVGTLQVACPDDVESLGIGAKGSSSLGRHRSLWVF